MTYSYLGPGYFTTLHQLLRSFGIELHGDRIIRNEVAVLRMVQRPVISRYNPDIGLKGLTTISEVLTLDSWCTSQIHAPQQQQKRKKKKHKMYSSVRFILKLVTFDFFFDTSTVHFYYL